METKNKKVALVTAAIGQKYLDEYNRKYRPSQERFASKIGAPLFVITDFIDKGPKAKTWHPAWQALLIFEIPELREFDYLMWIDGDIYVREDAQSPIDFITYGQPIWMAAKNNAYDLPTLTKTDPNLFKKCPKENRPNTMLNLGLFIADRKTFAPIFRHVYDTAEEQACYYQGPITYEFFNSVPGKVLPPYFNIIIVSYMKKYGRGLSTVLKCYRENRFIHFAGGVDVFMYYKLCHKLALQVERNPQSVISKMIKFIGQKNFDPATTFVIKVIRKLKRILKV
ncbi:TPA: hypothetical protein DCQ44_00325 [Candidatus Taylorbacteria bacterium]|nr:hypothetical protein [Candidatus Taylorbacteria bacterium]